MQPWLPWNGEQPGENVDGKPPGGWNLLELLPGSSVASVRSSSRAGAGGGEQAGSRQEKNLLLFRQVQHVRRLPGAPEGVQGGQGSQAQARGQSRWDEKGQGRLQPGGMAEGAQPSRRHLGVCCAWRPEQGVLCRALPSWRRGTRTCSCCRKGRSARPKNGPSPKRCGRRPSGATWASSTRSSSTWRWRCGWRGCWGQGGSAWWALDPSPLPSSRAFPQPFPPRCQPPSVGGLPGHRGAPPLLPPPGHVCAYGAPPMPSPATASSGHQASGAGCSLQKAGRLPTRAKAGSPLVLGSSGGLPLPSQTQLGFLTWHHHQLPSLDQVWQYQ